MHRLIVVILAAVDAAITAAVGIAATLAPLTLLWVLSLGGTADWGALWPAGAVVWQFGNLVPVQVTLPGDYLAVAGIDPGAASFVLSLAPLAFAGFTAISSARSGVRASRAESWVTGVIAGSLVFAALAALIALSSGTGLAAVNGWQAILFPALVFSIPLLIGAAVTEWCEAGSGFVARMRDRIEAVPHGWGEVPGLIARGSAVVLVGLFGLGALAFAVALVLRGGEVIALFEAAHVDVLGAAVVTLAQLAYLPTLAIWGMAFVAGPGFAVGTGTAVSPAGTQLGLIPGIPVLGVLPESTTPWLLLLALLPVALGALAGWIVRSRLVAPAVVADAEPAAGDEQPDRIGARAAIALGIAVLSAAVAALLSALASGSIGPGRLTEVGPQPGAVALAVGVEVLLGAAILLLSPRRPAKTATARDAAPPVTPAPPPEPVPEPQPAASAGRLPTDPDSTATADLGPRRPTPLPPLD